MNDFSHHRAVLDERARYSPFGDSGKRNLASTQRRKDSHMKNRASVLALAALAVAFPVSADGDQEIEFSAVVKRTSGVGWGTVANALNPHCSEINNQGQFAGDNTRLYSYELRQGHTQTQVQQVLTSVVAAGTLVYGEANYTAHAVNGQTGSLWVSDVGIGAAQYHDQYAGQLLGLTAAHNFTLGQGVTIAVLDSGVDPTHEAVRGPHSVFQWDFVGNDANPLDEGDGIDNDNDGVTDDGVGHGTYVTSLIRLVAPQARLMHLRVLDDEGRADAFTVAEAIDSAVAHGAQVINVSASTGFNSAALAEAVAHANQAGVIVISAMGNDNVAVPLALEYPAALAESFAICATGHADTKAEFSNWGTAADFSAPGASLVSAGGVYSPTTSVLGAVPGEGYAHWNGTSLSVAFMSGAAALIRSQYPTLPSAEIPAPLVPDFVMGKLSQSAVSIDALNPAYVGGLGVGRANVAAATLLGAPAPIVGDIDHDGFITSSDLSFILAGWGPCQDDACVGDLDGNAVVDGLDLSRLFSQW